MSTTIGAGTTYQPTTAGGPQQPPGVTSGMGPTGGGMQAGGGYGQFAGGQQYGAGFQGFQPGGGMSTFRQGVQYLRNLAAQLGHRFNLPYVSNLLQGAGRFWQPIPGQATALITGASSGIGAQFARVCAEHSINMVLVSDDSAVNNIRDQISAINPNIKVHTIVRDLGFPGAGREVFNECQRAGINIDILINNAAMAHIGKFVDADIERLIRIVQLDIVTMIELTHLFIRAMITRGHGRVLIVAGLNAYAPSPLMAVYGACAAFQLRFSEALNYELKGNGVSVTCVLPGPVKETQFPTRAGVPPGGIAWVPRAYRGWIPQLSPRHVAQSGFYGMLMNRTTIVPGLSHKLKALLCTILPDDLVMRVEYFLNSS